LLDGGGGQILVERDARVGLHRLGERLFALAHAVEPGDENDAEIAVDPGSYLRAARVGRAHGHGALELLGGLVEAKGQVVVVDRVIGDLRGGGILGRRNGRSRQEK
jgi:hypothetical protein